MSKIDWDPQEEYAIARVSRRVVAVVRRDSFSGYRNPLEETDHYPPCHIVVGYGSRKHTPDGSTEPDAPMLTREQIRDNAAKLAATFECRSLLALAQGGDWYWGRHAAEDVINDAIVDRLHDMAKGNTNDYHEALSVLYGIAGVDCLATSSHGYSQGDEASIFTWIPADKRDEYGNPTESLGAAAKEVSAWLWGDMYEYDLFFVLPSFDMEDGFNPDDHEDKRQDSCAGFFGDDHEASGLNETVLEMAAWLESEAAKKRKPSAERAAIVASVWRNATAA